MMIAYDDLYSIELFNRRQRAWWRRNGDDAADLADALPATTTIRCWRGPRLSTRN